LTQYLIFGIGPIEKNFIRLWSEFISIFVFTREIVDGLNAGLD